MSAFYSLVMQLNFKMVFVASLAALQITSFAIDETATVTGDRVNVRGQASLAGEVITQLKKGETVIVLEEITPAKVAKGDPAKWYKIVMPPNTPVWVNTSFIDPANKSVTSRRLNVRGGPGENYSILGRIEKGMAIKPIRTSGDWTEIEAPASVYGFVAGELLAISKNPATPTAPVTTAAPAPVPAPVAVVEPKPVETKVEGDTATVAVAKAPETPKPNAPVTEPAPTPKPPVPPVAANEATKIEPKTEAAADKPKDNEAPPKRIVSREGRIRRSLNIQAPSVFALQGLDGKTLINYLDVSKLDDIKLDPLEGSKVLVIGEEILDKRWPKTPVIVMDTFRLIP